MSQLKLKTTVAIGSITVFLVAACGDSATPKPGIVEATTAGIAATKDSNTKISDTEPSGANVIAVSLSGNPGSYFVSVMVDNPDIRCESFADWWEVVSDDGELLTRRVCRTTTGRSNRLPLRWPINVQPSDILIIRAHMRRTGYGGEVMRGTVAGGFASAAIPLGFATNLETVSPLPTSCAF